MRLRFEDISPELPQMLEPNSVAVIQLEAEGRHPDRVVVVSLELTRNDVVELLNRLGQTHNRF